MGFVMESASGGYYEVAQHGAQPSGIPNGFHCLLYCPWRGNFFPFCAGVWALPAHCGLTQMRQASQQRKKTSSLSWGRDYAKPEPYLILAQ